MPKRKPLLSSRSAELFDDIGSAASDDDDAPAAEAAGEETN